MIEHIIIGNNQIDKHLKYKSQYKKKTRFWGLGIENELYLEFENRKKITKDFFLNSKIRERYSIDYFSNYKKEYLDEALKKTLERMGNNVLLIPILINSHSFTKTDKSGNHKTLYKKNNPPNPLFSGKNLLEFLCEKDSFFSNQNDFWLFDGDTVEIINKKFYNKKLDKVLEEININKNIFIQKLNKIFQEEQLFTEFGKITYMKDNYPFASFLTNINNISMFNNGTIHLNLTLPTELDDNCAILDKQLFVSQHKKLIKLIQWMEPLIISVYGSPDPFATISNYKNKNMFSNCSQRNAVSRYVSLGTYNTDTMENGKILTKLIEDLPMSHLDFWWYKNLHNSSAYNSLDQIGMDINFNKHWNHGIEIRFLDHIPDNKLLYECFEFIIYLGDFVLNGKFDFINPITDEIWNKLVYSVMIKGIYYRLTLEEIYIYENIFDFKIKKSNVVDIYYEIFYHLKNKFNKIYKTINTDEYNNNYIIEPIGNLSKYVLTSQKFKNKPLFLEEKQDSYSTIFISCDEKTNNIECEKNKNLTYKYNDLTNVKNFKKNYDLKSIISNSQDYILDESELDTLYETTEDNNIKKYNKSCCIIM